jgi:prepilin-type processing-associated H-X9-DG protein
MWQAFPEDQLAAGIARELERVRGQAKGLEAAADGTSNTIFCSEVTPVHGDNHPDRRNVKGGTANVNDAIFTNGGEFNLGGARVNANWCLSNAQQPGARGLLRGTRNPNAGGSTVWRGGRSYDRHFNYLYFNTIMPPNGFACAIGGGENSTGVFPPQSYHSGGVNAGFLDGSVRFITDNINTNGLNGNIGGGNPDHSGPSVFGVWGALGSINGGESVSL